MLGLVASTPTGTRLGDETDDSLDMAPSQTCSGKRPTQSSGPRSAREHGHALAYAVLLALTPASDQARSSGGAAQAISVIGTLLLLSMTAVACILLAPLPRRRRRVRHRRDPGRFLGHDP
jgi:hypothetical protein